MTERLAARAPRLPHDVLVALEAATAQPYPAKERIPTQQHPYFAQALYETVEAHAAATLQRAIQMLRETLAADLAALQVAALAAQLPEFEVINEV